MNMILNNGVVRVVLLGTLLLGITSGILGVFTLLRKQALIGDALSHSTLPGVVIMFVITQSKDVNILIIGAAFSAALAILLINLLKRYSKISSDAVLALILSSFFGFGRFLISLISRYPDFSKARLDDFIFGSAATIVERDVYNLIITGLIVIFIILISYRQIKVHTFDSQYYQSLGFSSTLIDFLVSFMTIIVIVLGIRTVGVILMSALLIVPGIAARQWSDKLGINIMLAALFGSLSAIVGTMYSVNYTGGLPTGPVIVIVGTIIAIISIMFAPKRGLIAKDIKRRSHKKHVIKYKKLIHLALNSDDYLDDNDSSFLINEGLIRADNNQFYLTTSGYTLINKLMKGE